MQLFSIGRYVSVSATKILIKFEYNAKVDWCEFTLAQNRLERNENKYAFHCLKSAPTLSIPRNAIRYVLFPCCFSSIPSSVLVLYPFIYFTLAAVNLHSDDNLYVCVYSVRAASIMHGFDIIPGNCRKNESHMACIYEYYIYILGMYQ